LTPPSVAIPPELRRWRGQSRDHLAGVVERVAHPHALAVIAAARRLEHQRPAHLGAEGRERLDWIWRRRQIRPPRAWHAQRGEPHAHRRFVLREAQRARPRLHRDTVGGQRRDVFDGYVLVVEGHHVAASREGTQILERAEVTYDDVGRNERRAVLRRVCQDSQRLAERDGGLVRHTGQLAGADHADDRQSGALVHAE